MTRFFPATLLSLIALTILGCSSVVAPRGSAGSHVVLNVRSFGATGDAKTLDTDAFNKAIEAAESKGGGTVFVPSGRYRCYSIHLKSNVALYLDQGARILAAPLPRPGGNSPAYDPPEPNKWQDYQDFGHSHWHNSLIWGENLENIAILGPGKIDGDHNLHNDHKSDMATPGYANKAISLKLCRNVIIRDVTIATGGHFGILATGIDNFTLDNVRIDTNRDGVNIDCCRNVRVSNCTVNSPIDDGICLKSSYALGYARTTENVTITNCAVSGFEVGSLLDGTFKDRHDKNATGRIKFGTESNGGFRNITVSNCTFQCCYGLALMTVDGGPLEDIAISNITMRHIFQSPIFFRLGTRMRAPAGATIGPMRRISISNVVVDDDDSTSCSLICGVPGHDIEDVSISDVRIHCQGGGTPEQAALRLAENEKKYPEPTMFGPTPAYGFFIRHAKNVSMRNVALTYEKPDARPAFVLEDVKGIHFDHVTAQHETGAATMVQRDVKDLEVHESPALAP